ncbi:MAG: hypothetical protein COB37_05220 [Kordiimonadales bacterium]|nr:MAG: hypothetical protein COB37_05220 [Kordiimonadales bacterium]
MHIKPFNKLRSLLIGSSLVASLFCASVQAAGNQLNAQPTPAPVHSMIFTWINDHSAIHPYRKDALPALLKQGAVWTHLSFPDSLYTNGFDFATVPDEMHIMRFDDASHMQSVFSSPEYTEPAEKYFDRAFSRAAGYPATGADPTLGENGNFRNYFAIGLIDLADTSLSAEFVTAFEKAAEPFGLKGISMLTPMFPDTPDLLVVSSFTDKSGYDAFMTSTTGIALFKSQTTRYALVGGYDTKQPRL